MLHDDESHHDYEARLRANADPATAEALERRAKLHALPSQPAEQAGPTHGRRLTLKPASDYHVRPVRWLWEGRMALGTLALMAGREGLGKSTVCYAIAADITRGRLPGIYQGRPKAVVVAATEDSWEHTIVPRLMAAGADLKRVYQVGVTTAVGFEAGPTLPVDLDQLRQRIEEVDAALVLLDPLMSRLDAHLDTHKDAEVRQALEPLTAMANRCQVAFMGVIHLNKSGDTDPLTMLQASRAFPAVARAVLFVTADPENEGLRVLGQPKNNLGRTDLPSLTFTIEGKKVAETDEGPVWTGHVVWQGETHRSIDEVIRAANERGEVRTATQEAVEWLTDYLALHQVVASQRATQDAKEVGISGPTLKRARQKIGAGISTHGFPRRSYWSAPGLDPDQVDKLLSAQSDQHSGIIYGESDLTDLTDPTGEQSAQSAQWDQWDQPPSDMIPLADEPHEDDGWPDWNEEDDPAF